MSRRLKILIGAYACSPCRGSEAGVGWGWVQAISRHHDVWVIAGDHEPFPDGEYRYQDEIEAELDRHPELRERMHFHYIHKPRHLSLERIWSPSYLWFYRAWEKKALTLLKPGVDRHLDILGEGPCTAAWQRLARRLHVAGRCSWRGWLPRDEAVRAVHDSHVFVITSVKDLTSTVLLEALSQGVPVVCLDHCGFRDVVTPECGIKVPVRSPKQVEYDLVAALETLWRDEPLRRRMAEGALVRVRDFSWEKKAERIKAIYRNLAEAVSSSVGTAS